MGVITPYLGVFLDGRGLSSQDIGELMAIMTVARMIAPNLWASIADRTGNGLYIIRIGCCLALVSFVLLFFAESYWFITLCLALSFGFWTAVVPQLEPIALNEVEGDATKYSRVRMWGSVGFIGSSIICGALIDQFGSDITLSVSSALLFLLACMSFAMRQKNVVLPKKNSDESSIWRQTFTRPFLVFISTVTLLQMSFGVYYGFFALFMRDLGYSGEQTGLFIALGVIAEIGVFMIAGRLLKTMGLRVALSLCLFATALRWWLLAEFADILLVLIFSQLIHALSFGFAHTAAMHFIHTHFAAGFQNRGQALYVSISYGFGGAIGSYIAGQMWQQGTGAYWAWLVAAAMAFLGGAISLALRQPNTSKVATS